MSYLRKSSLPQQQNELREFVDRRLSKEQSEIKQRVYQWLLDNQYFADNELFDFYFCVAQNIAAVEVLGASGEKIVRAKRELEEWAEAYITQIVDTSNWIDEQLKGQLKNIEQNQQKLDTKLVRAIEELATRERNLQTISTGLVNSVSVLLKKQQQLVAQTETTTRYVRQMVMISWIVPIFILLGCVGILLMNAI